LRGNDRQDLTVRLHIHNFLLFQFSLR